MQTELAIALFEDHYGGLPEIVVQAPGRVNLIGEHTDYSDGFVMPIAIEYGVSVAARITDGPSRLRSSARGNARPFDAATVEPGRHYGWANYAAGMAWALRQHGYAMNLNIEATVTNDLPIGSGVSSSAALEVAFGLVWNALNGHQVPPIELARIAQFCENRFVGVNCGLMDMAASALGKSGHALLMDIRSMDVTPIPIPAGVSIVLCDTGKSRGLATSAYNERRAQVEHVCQMLNVRALRDVEWPDLEQAQAKIPGIEYHRAQHVVSENLRCLDFAAALVSGDLGAAGNLMIESHTSLADLFEVSCDELDAMVDACLSSEDCYGARMTGAGFGGACVALVTEHSTDNFVITTQEEYRQACPDFTSRFLVCHPSDGAKIVK